MQSKKSAVVKRVQNGIITEYMAINSKLPQGKQIKRFPVKTSEFHSSFVLCSLNSIGQKSPTLN